MPAHYAFYYAGIFDRGLTAILWFYYLNFDYTIVRLETNKQLLHQNSSVAHAYTQY